MMLGRSERWPAFIDLVGLVAEEPVLSRLKAADDRMAGSLRVRGRVLRRRGVATADVAALRAPPQVDPPAGSVAFDAAGTARRNRWLDAGYCGHVPCPLAASAAMSWTGSFPESAAVTGSQTRNLVSPGTDSTFRSPWCLVTTIRHEISS